MTRAYGREDTTGDGMRSVQQDGSDRSALVDVGVHTIAYRRAGSGPPLMLLHGFLADSRMWRHQMNLADSFTVVAWDAPGAGSSSDPAAPFTITDWAASLSAFLDATGIHDTHVVGLSWGGLLAQELWRTNPSRVRSLVLADTYAGWLGSFGVAAAQERLARCIRDSSLPVGTLVRDWVAELFTRSAPSDLIEETTKIMAGYHPAGFRLMAEALAVTDTTEQPLAFNSHVARFCSWVDGTPQNPDRRDAGRP